MFTLFLSLVNHYKVISNKITILEIKEEQARRTSRVYRNEHVKDEISRSKENNK